jgi:hypothetical protein
VSTAVLVFEFFRRSSSVWTRESTPSFLTYPQFCNSLFGLIFMVFQLTRTGQDSNLAAFSAARKSGMLITFTYYGFGHETTFSAQ